MFAEAEQVPAGTQVEVDLCIVGAGAAGITLAREFVGGPLRVALLESGGLDLEAETQALYQGDVVGVPYFPLDAPRLRYFGGTTNHWAGVCRPFEPVDFERREWIPFSGWPFAAAELDPYYLRAQDVVQLTSHRWDTADWVELIEPRPLPLDEDRVAVRVDQLVPPERRSFATLYEDELRSAANVTVYLEANVTEVLTDESGAAATDVAVATLTGNRFTVSARAFVVAVGGIDNARVLLASRGRHPTGIGNQNDLVGRFFAEHPRFMAGIVAPADLAVSVGFYQERTVDGTIVQPRLAISRDVQEAEGLADVQFRIDPVYDEALERATESSDVASLKALRRALSGDGSGELAQDLSNVVSDLMTWHSVMLPGAPLPVPYPEVLGELIRSTPRERLSLLPGLLGEVSAFLLTRIKGDLPVDNLVVTARFEQLPNPESRVTLAEQRDELGVPRAVLDWRLTDADRHNVRRAMEILGAEIGRAGVGRLRILFEEEGSAWPEDLVGGYHLMGTTRMHVDPRQGVVDPDGRVHGMSNLFVAGSSVFPTGGSGNPTLLIVALALRLADHLKQVVA